MTSSKISSAPVARRRARAAARGSPSAAGRGPCSPGRARRGSPRTRARRSRARTRVGVVPRHDRRCSAVAAAGTPGLAGMRLRREAAAGLGEQAVDVAVVGAGELQDLLAPGRRAGEPHRAHRRLGARRRHAQHLDRRHAPRDLLGQLDLAVGRRAEGRARARAASATAATTSGCAWPWIERAPRADPVDVAVAVDVDDLGARARARRRAGRARSRASRAPAS